MKKILIASNDPKEKQKEIINVDTLCENFEKDEEITISALKSRKLISQKAKRIKILAPGELNKKLTVVADSFSTDAAKMIFALGGKIVRLKKRGKNNEK